MISRPGFFNNMKIRVGAVEGDPGRAIRRWRTNNGWSQRELAKRVGKTQGFISSVELNRTELSTEEYAQIASAMGISLERMLGSVC